MNNSDSSLLKNHKHFVKLANQFDSVFNTNTYAFSMTLKKINETFFQRDLQHVINSIISNIFKKENVVYSNDKNLNVDDTVKLYSIYKIVKDMQTGIGLLHPINLHYFGKNKVSMHPGNTRLLFSSQYLANVDVIITDYTNIIKKVYKNVEFLELQDCKFSCNELFFLINTATKDHGPRSIYNNVNKEIVYKEVKHLPTADNWSTIPHRDSIIYEMRTNKLIYVNSHKIMYKKENTWRFDV